MDKHQFRRNLEANRLSKKTDQELVAEAKLYGLKPSEHNSREALIAAVMVVKFGK